MLNSLPIRIIKQNSMGNVEYSSGSRSGRIVKVARAGILFKTIECEMIMDGMSTVNNQMSSSIPYIWHFSLDAKKYRGEDTEGLKKELEQSMKDGKPVTLQYWRPLVSMPCRGHTGFYATSMLK